MKYVTIWLIGNDFIESSSNPTEPNPLLAACRYQAFCCASQYELDQDGNMIAESCVAEAPPNLRGRKLITQNISSRFVDDRKKVSEQVTISQRIYSLISACSNTVTYTSYYFGFQYPLALKIIKRVSDTSQANTADSATQADIITSADYLLNSCSELTDFLLYTLRPMLMVNQSLEAFADSIIFKQQIAAQNANFVFWQNLGDMTYGKAEDLFRNMYSERCYSNYHYAQEYFEKALQIFGLQEKTKPVPSAENIWLQTFSAIQYAMFGTRDQNARIQAEMLIKLGHCKSKQDHCLSAGKEEFNKAYTLLYDAFGSSDKDTRVALNLYVQSNINSDTSKRSQSCVNEPRI